MGEGGMEDVSLMLVCEDVMCECGISTEFC